MRQSPPSRDDPVADGRTSGLARVVAHRGLVQVDGRLHQSVGHLPEVLVGQPRRQRLRHGADLPARQARLDELIELGIAIDT
jgi:hypothetical protein